MNPQIPQAQFSPSSGYSYTPYGSMPNVNTLSQIDKSISDAQQATTPQPNQNPTPGSNENIFERLLPTAGSILGGLVPIPGVDILTAALGGAAGRAAENALTGQKVLQTNDLVSGAEGALGQGVGGLASVALGKGAGILSNIAGRQAAKSVSEDAASAASAQAAKAVDEAMALKNAYADVPKGLRQQYNAGAQTDFIRNLGLDATNPQNLVDTGTNANDILSSYLNKALSDAGPVDLSNYNGIVRNAIANESNSLGSFDQVAMGRGRLGPANTPASKLLSNLEQQGMGLSTSAADPVAARQLIGKLQAMAQDAKPSISSTTGAIDPVQKATYNAINEVVNNLKSSLYNRPELNDAITAFKGNIQPEDVGGNQLLADHINNVLSGASKGQDVLDELSRFTNMSKLGQAASRAQQDVASPATLARVQSANPSIQDSSKTGNLINGALNLGSMYEGLVGGHPAALMAPLALKAIQNPQVLGAGASTLGKIGSSMLPSIAGEVIANSPNDIAGATNSNENGVSLQEPNMQDSLLNQLMQAEAASAILQPNVGGASSANSLFPLAQKMGVANNALQGVTNEFNLAGGAQGPLGGLLSRLGATFTGAPAAQLPAQEAAAAQAIGSALGISPAQVESALPKITQNKTAAQAAVNNVQNLISALGLGGLQQPASVLGSL